MSPPESDGTTDEPQRERASGEQTGTDRAAACSPSARAADPDDSSSAEESVGVGVPEEHVGAFVAEAFEDVERTTTWTDVVDAMVAPGARAAWEDLSPRAQAVEVLDMAADYDEGATERLAALPRTGTLSEDEEATYREALRLRRNADAFRDGIASAYAEGHLDDSAIVGAVEDAGFETDGIATREDELDAVASAHDLEYRPYGGTLFDQDEGGDERRDVDPW